jgi:aminopeptidase N
VFAANFEAFHGGDVSSYAFLAQQIVALDKLNPQVAARLTKSLESWRSYSQDRGVPMRDALESILNSDELSPDVYELVLKSLN